MAATPHKCDKCGKEFDSFDDFTRHLSVMGH